MPLKEESGENETSPLHPDQISSCRDLKMPSASPQQGQRFEKHPKVRRTQFLWIISLSGLVGFFFFNLIFTVLSAT